MWLVKISLNLQNTKFNCISKLKLIRQIYIYILFDAIKTLKVLESILYWETLIRYTIYQLDGAGCDT